MSRDGTVRQTITQGHHQHWAAAWQGRGVETPEDLSEPRQTPDHHSISRLQDRQEVRVREGRWGVGGVGGGYGGSRCVCVWGGGGRGGWAEAVDVQSLEIKNDHEFNQTNIARRQF